MHARRGDRAARRGRDLLSSGARPDVLRGPGHADPRLRGAGARRRTGPAAARRARGGALRTAGERSRGSGRSEEMTPGLKGRDTGRTADLSGPATIDASGGRSFDVERVRADFPILSRQIFGKPLVYLDNAATTQKPRRVLDAIASYYTDINANVHRGVHELSGRATDAYEAARGRVRAYFNAASTQEIVFTRNATEGINLVAYSFIKPRLRPGDEVLISAMEHHSNIVPWQIVCEGTGATLAVAPIDDRGELILEEFERRLTPRTTIAAITHMSNALGTITPVAEIVRIAHAHQVPVLLDASQAAYHMRIDVRALDCDFLVATGHKLYGPTGIGVLYGKQSHLDAMPPFMGGGDMISSVTFERSAWNVLPYKFEEGTPHIAGAIGLHAALDYIDAIGFDAIGAHERDLLDYGTGVLQA